MRYPKDGTLTEQEFKNTNYGIDVPRINSFSEVSTKNYLYLAPTGGTYPYRQDDFDKYNHNSKFQYKISFPSKITNNSKDNFFLFTENYVSDKSLTLWDLFAFSLESLYIIAEIKSSIASEAIYMTTTIPITNSGIGNFDLQVDLRNIFTSYFNSGSSDCTLAVCNFKMNSPNTASVFPSNMKFWVLPYTNINQVKNTVSNSGSVAPPTEYKISIISWNILLADWNEFSGTFTIQNKGDGYLGFSSNKVKYNLYLTYTDSAGYENFLNQEFRNISPSAASLYPDDTAVISFDFYTSLMQIRTFEWELTVIYEYGGGWQSIGSTYGVYER